MDRSSPAALLKDVFGYDQFRGLQREIIEHAFIDGLELFGRGYSWGGYESLLVPSFPERIVKPAHAGPLFRISAGLEDPEDLLEDLAEGFGRLRRG